MKILYIALSCGPTLGSEDAVGWNVPMAMLARGHEIAVLTRADKREEIETYQATHPELEYPSFYYQPLSSLAKHCKGPFYSTRAKLWCSEAVRAVGTICLEWHPDVVHQITPVEFRAPVNLSGVSALKVFGPIGGGGNIPKAFDDYLRPKDHIIEVLRRALNKYAVRSAAVQRSYASYDCVMATNDETYAIVAPLCKDEVFLHSEVAVDLLAPVVKSVHRDVESELVIGFAGRLHYRKGIPFLLNVVNKLDIPFRLLIAGDGPERTDIEEDINSYGLGDRVKLLGYVSHDDMPSFYERLDLFVFPSLREATGSVLVEALAAGVPVVSLGIFGANVVLRDNPDFLISCDGSFDDISTRFASAIERFYSGEMKFDFGTERLTWSLQASYLEDVYKRRIELSDDPSTSSIQMADR